MTEIIRKFNTGFTQIPNEVLYNSELSLRAKGLYSYLFSKPDSWVFHIETMNMELKETKGQIYTTLRELITSGFLERKQVNENGCFGGVVYEFIEMNRVRKKPCTEKTVYGKTRSHNNTDNTNNTNNINNIYNIYTENNEFSVSVDYGSQIRIGKNFKINFEDEFFHPYRLASKDLTSSIENWFIKNKLGQVIDKNFICRQITNFAKRQGSLSELLGAETEK